MHCPKRTNAFTLIELLVVMAISAGLITLTAAFGVRARQTFVSQQYLKTMLQESRIARRKSMLITRNSQDNGWVHGIGMQLSKQTDNTWQLTLIKALESDKQSFFYRAYPKEFEKLEFAEIDSSTRQYLPEGVTITAASLTAQSKSEKDCLANMTELRIIFESINGKLHAYCYNPQVAPGFIAVAESTDGSNNQEITLSLKLSNGNLYPDKLKLSVNGDLSTVR